MAAGKGGMLAGAGGWIHTVEAESGQEAGQLQTLTACSPGQLHLLPKQCYQLGTKALNA